MRVLRLSRAPTCGGHDEDDKVEKKRANGCLAGVRQQEIHWNKPSFTIVVCCVVDNTVAWKVVCSGTGNGSVDDERVGGSSGIFEESAGIWSEVVVG